MNRNAMSECTGVVTLLCSTSAGVRLLVSVLSTFTRATLTVVTSLRNQTPQLYHLAQTRTKSEAIHWGGGERGITPDVIGMINAQGIREPMIHCSSGQNSVPEQSYTAASQMKASRAQLLN
jgi:hypothetical protein